MKQIPIFADMNAEKGVMGALLYEGDIFPDLKSILSPEMFYTPQLGACFKAYSDQYEKESLVDLGTLASIANVPVHHLADCMSDEDGNFPLPSLAVVNARKVADLYYKRHVYRETMQ